MTAEHHRLDEDRRRVKHWKRWGPYLSERAWGTVREDYSAGGQAWGYLPYDQARSRAYRWNEDGLAGLCDRHQRICFALALWNGRDPHLKERLFGLGGPEGNHGEDVKEYYFYLDSTPTHSYMKFLYKYPQARFPYERLLDVSRSRGRDEPEFELHETGVFADNRYFDVFVEYAKADPDDILVDIRVVNRGPEDADLHLLPTVWFRNRWSWTADTPRPHLEAAGDAVRLEEPDYGERWMYCDAGGPRLFTENESNLARLFGVPCGPYTKDAFHRFVVDGETDAVNPRLEGTKAAVHVVARVGAGATCRVRVRLTHRAPAQFAGEAFADFDEICETRRRESDAFYAGLIPESLTPDEANVMRSALAGLLWSKQFYHYVVGTWLNGDPLQPSPPAQRLTGRNAGWTHLYAADVLSMPDKWEYPWFAGWDLAFHCVPLALVDAEFAKQQLTLLLREWYMHPNGAMPAYEWALGDVNPPVHAWAAWRVYKIEKRATGSGDRVFLERVFQKLLLNFTWWVNRKDAEGNNVFEGGFLGLDNIGIFDRSQELPTGGYLEQSDGTSWMAMYCLNMLAIAMELSEGNPAYEDMASKFWEHFLYIANASYTRNQAGELSLWDDIDGFFYDVLCLPSGHHTQLKIRSAVGLIPLFAVETLEPDRLAVLEGFTKRLEWFVANRPDLISRVASMTAPGLGERRLLSILSPDKLRRVLHVMLDESEFLSPYGVRAMSQWHAVAPYELLIGERIYRVDYEPGESRTPMFGGNSNWRGPIWFPINFLIIESLQKFHHYLGDTFTVECPTGSGQYMTLDEVARELERRLCRLFARDGTGRRPTNGGVALFDGDPHWRDYLMFHEYFHGDDGRGLGASHQTGWTALVAKLLHQLGSPRGEITVRWSGRPTPPRR